GMAIQADNKILLGGISWVESLQKDVMAVFRLNANGMPDTAFGGGDGVADYLPEQLGAYINVGAVCVTPDGKILQYGTQEPPSGGNTDWLFLRYNADGTPDKTFGGGDGVLTIDWGAQDISPTRPFCRTERFSRAARARPASGSPAPGSS